MKTKLLRACHLASTATLPGRGVARNSHSVSLAGAWPETHPLSLAGAWPGKVITRAQGVVSSHRKMMTLNYIMNSYFLTLTLEGS